MVKMGMMASSDGYLATSLTCADQLLSVVMVKRVIIQSGIWPQSSWSRWNSAVATCKLIQHHLRSIVFRTQDRSMEMLLGPLEYWRSAVKHYCHILPPAANPHLQLLMWTLATRIEQFSSPTDRSCITVSSCVSASWPTKSTINTAEA